MTRGDAPAGRPRRILIAVALVVVLLAPTQAAARDELTNMQINKLVARAITLGFNNIPFDWKKRVVTWGPRCPARPDGRLRCPVRLFGRPKGPEYRHQWQRCMVHVILSERGSRLGNDADDCEWRIPVA